MKKIISYTITSFIVIIISTSHIFSQVQGSMQSFDADKTLMITEFGTMIVEEEDKVIVKLIIGNKDDSDINTLEQGDAIIMINGKRIKDMAGFKSIYDAIEPDKAIQLGIQRGDSRFIVEELKGSGKSVDDNETKFRTFTRRDGKTEQLTTYPANLPESHILSDLGLTLVEFEGKIIVNSTDEDVLPQNMQATSPLAHNLTKIGDTEISSIKQLNEIYSAIKVGEEFDIYFELTGKKSVYTFKKPESKKTSFERN